MNKYQSHISIHLYHKVDDEMSFVDLKLKRLSIGLIETTSYQRPSFECYLNLLADVLRSMRRPVFKHSFSDWIRAKDR